MKYTVREIDREPNKARVQHVRTPLGFAILLSESHYGCLRQMAFLSNRLNKPGS